MQNTTTKGLYIMTHKAIPGKGISRYPQGRKLMLVGANGRKLPEGYYSDYDEKLDNISAKNYCYCELTGFYYMVKYDKSDILGLEHYRRLFTKSKHSKRAKPLTESDIDKLMEKYDLIVPTHVHYQRRTNKENYCNWCFPKDYEIVEEIIAKDYPEYVDAMNKFSNSKNIFYRNMMIGKREIIVDYAKWMFDILAKLEKQIDISCRDTYQKRIYGFMSERLLNVYLLKHPEIKICERKENFIKGL